MSMSKRMMEAASASTNIKAACPSCSAEVSISAHSNPGGVRDRGGVILQCSSCDTKFDLHLGYNYDSYQIASGAIEVDRYNDDIEGSQKRARERHKID